MQRPISVHMLPDLVESSRLTGAVVVVIDILRASTTITTALYHGAEQVIPCLTVEQATTVRDSSAAGTVLLGGERGGIRIAGFDLSNSPADYSSAVVGGRTIAFTTTNGTRALLQCQQADLILVGSFLNLSAITGLLKQSERPLHLVCAGTDGHITAEDILYAGAIVHQLTRTPQLNSMIPDVQRQENSPCPLPDDSARLALSFWKDQIPFDVSVSSREAEQLIVCVEQSLRQSRGGQNLLELSYDSDLTLCSRIDSAPVIPRFFPAQGVITGDASPAVRDILT